MPLEPASALDKLAWQIWSANGTAVLIEDPVVRFDLAPSLERGTLLEGADGFRFSDNTVMIEAAARYLVSSKPFELNDNPRHCFECLHDIWDKEIGKQDSVSGHALAILHNLHYIDAFSWGQKAIEEGCKVFHVLHVFEGAIPLFSDASAKSIVSFFVGHYEKVKNDLMGGRLFPKLDKWFATHPHIAYEVHQMHLQKIQENSANVFRSAMQGLASNDFPVGLALIKEAAISKEPLVSGPAIYALGRIDFSNVERSKELADVVEICRSILESPSHPSSSTAITTLGELLTFDESIATLLIQAGQKENPETLYALSNIIFLKDETYGERDWFGKLLQLLAVTKLEYKGVLSNIDMILMKWIHSDLHQQVALHFIDAWLSKQNEQNFGSEDLKAAFPSTLAELAKKPELLSKTLTKWLLMDDRHFPLAAYGLVSPHLRLSGTGSVHLDATALDSLTQSEFRFLARRILGYLTGESILIQLIFSMVYTRDSQKRSFELIKEVLLNHVGYDYPLQTAEYLMAQQKIPEHGEDIRQLCDYIIREIESRMKTLSELPVVKELQPPFLKAHRFRKERGRQMNEAFEEASKDSIWRHIATRIPLKAGRRTFQNLDGRYTQPMELNSFSQSITIPRSEVNDPAGAARERVLFRSAKRDDQ